MAEEVELPDLEKPQNGDVEMEDYMEDKVGQEVKITPDGGVLKKILVLGTGYNYPEDGDDVEVHYVGTLEDGTQFDSSRERGSPFNFSLGQGNVIKGWDLGVKTMKKGEKSLLTCKADYAYGQHGSPPKIPPGATLNFEVELLSWKSHKDISGDGGIIKTVVTAGSGWKKPGPDDEVKVAYTLKTEDGNLVETSPEGGAEFTLSSGYLIPAFAKAVEGMKKDEEVSLVISPQYGFGEAGKPPLVGSDSVLHADLKLVSWKTVEKITPDGGVLKKTLNDPSSYQTPSTDSKIKIRYTGKLEDGTVFDERGEGNELECLADDDALIEGLDLALMKMKSGEVAEVVIMPQYAFGTNEPSSRHYNPAVPSNATVIYTVELVHFEPDKNSWDLKEDEKVTEAIAAKERGNAKFKAGLWPAAIKRYERATKLIDYDKDFSEENLSASTEVKRSCYLNLAAAQLKLMEFMKAVDACNKVLEKDSQNVKALYRRAQAYLGRQDFVEAEQDIKAALTLDPASRDLRSLHQQWKRASAEYAKKEKQIFGNIFEKMARAKVSVKAVTDEMQQS
eukprot:jgi/Botrbrau1/7388/Bobra.0316s0031.2